MALGGIVAGFVLLSGAVGQYIAGRLLDKYKPENLYLFSIVFGTIFAFLITIGSNLILILSSILYAFFYFSIQPVQNYIISQYLPKHRHGFGYGMLFFLTFGVGSTAAVVSGWIADRFGLVFVFYSMGFCFIVSSCLALILTLNTKR